MIAWPELTSVLADGVVQSGLDRLGDGMLIDVKALSWVVVEVLLEDLGSGVLSGDGQGSLNISLAGSRTSRRPETPPRGFEPGCIARHSALVSLITDQGPMVCSASLQLAGEMQNKFKGLS